MAARYQLVDTTVLPRDKALGRKAFPSAANAGRFNSLAHALRELKACVGPDRFILVDRETGEEVRPS